MAKTLRIIFTIFLAIIPVYIGFLLAKKSPDIRYTLSEEIPLSFSNIVTQSTETVQQLEVKNLGNAPSEKIVIKIDKPITSYEIQKYTELDKTQVFTTTNSFELIYPTLPPQAGFLIILKSTANGISKSDIGVSDSTGTAREALSTENPLIRIIPSIFYYLAALIFLFFTGNQARKDIVSMRKRSMTREPIKEIINLKKPWYFFRESNESLRIETLRASLENEKDLEYSLEKSKSYMFLDIEKPYNFNDASWTELSEIAVENLTKGYVRNLKDTFSENRIINLLVMKCPERFPASKWGGLLRNANNSYVKLVTTNRCISIIECIKKLSEDKPDPVSTKAWLEITDYYQNNYMETIERGLIYSEDPFSFLQQQNLSYLRDDQIKTLEDEAQRYGVKIKYKNLSSILNNILNDIEISEEDQPLYVEDYEWNEVIRLRNRFKNIERASNKSENLEKLLRSIVRGKNIVDEKPELFTETEWRIIKDFEERVKSLIELEQQKASIKDNESELYKEKSKFESVKSKVLRQLEIINNLLNDPSSIDKIEDYDLPFSKGNLDNLRKISKLLLENGDNK